MSLSPGTQAESEALKAALFNDAPNLAPAAACTRLLMTLGFDERTASEAAARAVDRAGEEAPTSVTVQLAAAALHDIADDLSRLLRERATLADEAPPSPIDGDPPGGIPVHGGDLTVGRGVKKDDKGRPYVYAWIKGRAHDFTMWCHDTAWYQYMYVTLILDGKDVTEDVRKKMEKHHIDIPTSNGSELHFGEFGPDYDHKHHERQVQDAKRKGERPPPGLSLYPGGEAFPYPDLPIPGTPGASGFSDSPNYIDALPGIFARLRLKVKPPAAKQPPDETFSVEIDSHFHTYVYCIDPEHCLGWFEWDSKVTATMVVTWDVDPSESAGIDKGWVAKYSVAKAPPPTSEVTVGPWQDCGV